MRAPLLLVLALAACSVDRQDGPGVLDVPTTDVDFGAVLSGASAQKIVRLRNTGNGPLELSRAAIDGDDRGAFEIDVAPGIAVPGGGTLEIVIRYDAPSAAGLDRATLAIGDASIQLLGSSRAVIAPRDGGISPDAEAPPPLAGFVFIPAGQFVMGSPEGEAGRFPDEPEHTVTITRAFWLKETPVTQVEWRDLMGTDTSSFADCGDDCPVERVTWNDAVAYVNVRSLQERLPACYPLAADAEIAACRGYRLPTEAEWEYAARAGTTTAFPSGDLTATDCGFDIALDAIGWYCGNAGDTTHRVRRKPPNAWLLYDTHGNVWEWVHDWDAPYPLTATDPQGPAAGALRIFRGGAFYSPAELCRSAKRWRALPNYPDRGVGFRVARTVLP